MSIPLGVYYCIRMDPSTLLNVDDLMVQTERSAENPASLKKQKKLMESKQRCVHWSKKAFYPN